MQTYSLYIHIPFCTSKCTYCDFFSIPVGSDFSFCDKTQKIFKDYVLALKKELEYYFENFSFITFDFGSIRLISFCCAFCDCVFRRTRKLQKT